MNGRRNRSRLACALTFVLLITGIAQARADDSPCAPIAEAVEANTLRVFLERPDAETLIYDLFDDEELSQQTTIGMDWDQSHALAMDAVRRQLAASDPALPDAMAEAVSNIVQHGRTWLLRADINNDGSDDWWLKTAGGRFYCETNWFYDGGPPYPFMGRIGSAGMEEGECGYHLDAIRVGNTNYLTKKGNGAFRVLAWRAPEDFEEVCNVHWKASASGRFETETLCDSEHQPLCNRIAELAASLTRNESANLAMGPVPDLPLVRVDGQDEGSLSVFDFGEFADVDNDGDQDIFAGGYSEDFRGQQRIIDFYFALVRWIDGGYRFSSPGTMQAWFGPYRDSADRVAYPVVFEGRTYIVVRRRWERGDPGTPGGYTLEILEIANDESRIVGLVNAKPIFDFTIDVE